MSTIHRRNSQRLASALEALTSDLDITASEVETDENISSDLTPEQYVDQDVEGREYDARQYLGGDDDFETAFAQAMAEDDDSKCPDCGEKECVCGSIEQGDPGVDDFGSELTYDTDNVRQLGSEYGVDFDGDENLQPTIRNVPGRAQKRAKIRKLIARIENVANHLERTGRKKLAYRLDIVCNNLEEKYNLK